MGAFFFTDSIPFTQASFDEYASLVAIISPLAATRRNLNFPALSLNHSNFGSGNIDTKESYQKNLLKSASQVFGLDWLLARVLAWKDTLEQSSLNFCMLMNQA
jgi:hypothetical protein